LSIATYRRGMPKWKEGRREGGKKKKEKRRVNITDSPFYKTRSRAEFSVVERKGGEKKGRKKGRGEGKA